MSDDKYWTSAPDRMLRGSMGLCHLTVFEPPFTVDARDLPPQDAARARAFAESLEGIEEVLEDLGPRSVQTPLPSDVRADLDVAHAAAWGNMLSIADPAFATDGNDEPLRSAAGELRERFPDARIVGRVAYHGGMEHTEDVVWLPDGAMFHASGWYGEDPFVVTGDPGAVIASLGLKSWMLDNAGVDLDEEANEVEWARLAGLALGRSDPWGWEQMQTTAFRVRHSESAVRNMEQLYFV
ncbi:hypothetical protein GCM10012287_54730 [Streptomyces daqingensis]|uniref:Uncharacterized protein n=1 Tax=Streptomyces daqingensis TaxID=1472640 RepID=A0ABQ2MSB1_9ACTN|nr:DUF6333 family protein [Streptomyces daqingensis]GGO57876.1 hypothetical protein GCM10012287_54730 [Streptomyces daqingensis]